MMKLPRNTVEFRALEVAAPLDYESASRSFECILSKGALVQRVFGQERLVVNHEAVDLSRMSTCGIPCCDSHQQDSIRHVLGRLESAWIRSGALHGRIWFGDTQRARRAEGMVSRGEISGISIGYKVMRWAVEDEDGKPIDPQTHRFSFDENYVFVAKRWQLLEVSVVCVPADSDALIVSSGVAAARRRMAIRQRMLDHQMSNH